MASLRWVVAIALPLALTGCSENGTGPNGGQAGEVFNATLNADAVVEGSPVSSATGTSRFALQGEALSYTIDVNDINAVIMAHIHGPATPEQAAGIILTLFEPDNPTGTVNGRLVSGTVTPELLTAGWTQQQVLNLMRTGQAYVLVHTSAYPDGEIRGHLTLE